MKVTVSQRMNTTDNRNISITIYQQYNRVSQAEAINNITECVTHRVGPGARGTNPASKMQVRVTSKSLYVSLQSIAGSVNAK